MNRKFIPQRKNANKHTQRGLRLLERSLQRDGWIDAQTAAADGEIISGSARLEVAAEKFADVEPIIVESDGTRPVIVVRKDIPNADDPRARRLSVAANQIAHVDYDPDGDLLMQWAEEDKQLREMFDDLEWSEFVDGDPETRDAEPQIDRAEELREKWGVETGQLWQIGEHRLICGDCTDAAVVERVMGGDKIDCVLTSPPYNQGNTKGDLFSHGKRVENLYPHSEDNMSEDDYMAFIFSALDRCAENVNDIHSVVWNVSYNANSRNTYGKIIFSDKNPFSVFETIAWNKGGSINIPQVGIYSRQCEFVFIMARGEKYLTSQLYGNSRWNYWETKRQNQTKEHHAAFPLEFAERGIKEFSVENNIIYEPFAGTGTTMVACQNLGRKCRAVEISPAYCAVILERMATAFPNLSIARLE